MQSLHGGSLEITFTVPIIEMITLLWPMVSSDSLIGLVTTLSFLIIVALTILLSNFSYFIFHTILIFSL